jgi:hypothetical protein
MRVFAKVKSIDQIDVPEIKPGFWIKVRRELSVGEKRDVFGAALKGQTTLEDGKIRTEYDAARLSFGLVCAHVVDWNFTDDPNEDGNVVRIECSPDAIKGLSSEAYDVIDQALDAYIQKAKQDMQGEGKPAQTSNDATISNSVAG